MAELSQTRISTSVQGIARSLATPLVVISVLAGCSGDDDAAQVEDRSIFVCQEAKTFIKALDYILRSSEVKRIPRAYAELGSILHDEKRKSEFAQHSETLQQLAALSREVKSLLEQKPPKLEPARPKVDEMMKLAESLPGGDVRLEEVWELKPL